MAIVRQLSGSGAGLSPNASTTRFTPLLGGCIPNSGTLAESAVQLQIRSGGTYSQMYGRNIQAATAAATLHLNVNTATNGNSLLTIQATGEYTDETHTDAVTSANLVTIAVTSGATTQIKLTLLGASFSATSNTVARIGAWASASNYNTASTHYYEFTGADAATNTTQANAQYKIETGGTAQNIQINVQTNAHTSNGSLTLQIGGVAGNCSATITTATGIFEDTTHTDTISATNILNFDLLTGTGNLTFTARIMSIELSTTDSSWVFGGGTMAGITQAANVTNFLNMSGDEVAGAAEANVQFLTDNAFNASFNGIRVITNTVSADSTFRLRKNGGNVNQTATITASTTGWFEDATNNDNLVATDEINYTLITPNSGTSLVYTLMGIVISPTKGGSTPVVHLLASLGIGS